MNVWLAVKVLSHALGKQKWVYVLIISVAISAGISLMLVEKGVRLGSAQVANNFDLLIASPGSKIDAVLNLVYVQNEILEPIPFRDWHPVMADERVAWVSPIVKGDSIHGLPVIGVTANIIAAIYGEEVSFESITSALVGDNTPFNRGQKLVTQHGGFLAEEGDEQHLHSAFGLTVQRRLPKSHTPWDNVILIPVEQIWRMHSLTWTDHEPTLNLGDAESDHENHHDTLIATQDWASLTFAPDVLALVVKPKRLSDAFALRSDYSNSKTMAFFPAEVLVRLHALLGNARDLLTTLTVLCEALVMLSVVAGLTTWMQLLAPTFTLLRAMGAPSRYVLLSVWSAIALLMLVACSVGLLLGFGLAYPISHLVSQQLQIPVNVLLSWQESWFAIGLFLVSALFTLWPAILSFRKPLSSAIRRL